MTHPTLVTPIRPIGRRSSWWVTVVDYCRIAGRRESASGTEPPFAAVHQLGSNRMNCGPSSRRSAGRPVRFPSPRPHQDLWLVFDPAEGRKGDDEREADPAEDGVGDEDGLD